MAYKLMFLLQDYFIKLNYSNNNVPLYTIASACASFI